MQIAGAKMLGCCHQPAPTALAIVFITSVDLYNAMQIAGAKMPGCCHQPAPTALAIVFLPSL